MARRRGSGCAAGPCQGRGCVTGGTGEPQRGRTAGPPLRPEAAPPVFDLPPRPGPGDLLARVRLFPAHLLAAALCLGLAAATAVRCATAGPGGVAVAVSAGGLAAGAALAGGRGRVVLLAAALVVAGWWWGSARLGQVDASALAGQAGAGGHATLVLTESPRSSGFGARVAVQVLAFRGDELRGERALARLPSASLPDQGDVIDAVVVLEQPRAATEPGGFDERRWLARRGVHAVVRVTRWQPLGRRGGLGGAADQIRRRVAAGLHGAGEGTRGALVAGVVLGADDGVADTVKEAFRVSGLYHVMAVSGQNIAFVAAGVLFLAWLLGIPRWTGELGALAAIGGYVLAVGASPSVIRAGIAGALGSLAWLAGRARDRVHVMLIGAAVLLAWNPYVLLDVGFQLSFTAVAAIFWLAPPISRRLRAAGLPRLLAEPMAISTACSLATAPVLWLQFQAVPLLSVPANALAGPAVAPLLGCALVAAALHPVLPGAALALGWLAGWCAAWIALVARAVAALPLAQATSGTGALAAALVTAAAGAYAWRRWRTS